MTRPISKKYFLPLVLLTISLPVIAADSLPTAQDINDAAQKAKQTCDSFFTQTFTIRMQYEYSGRFLNPQDKDTLCKTAQQASTDLEQIANTQTAMKQAIEAYQKDDWETLFGQTGLWRKLSADLTHTQTGKLEIDYCLARIEGKTGSQAEQQYLRQASRSNWAWCEAIKLSMEKIKCRGLSEPNELDDIADSLAKSECKDNPEMLLSLAILQNKYAPDKLQSTLSRSAGVTELFAKIILADLSSDANLASLNPVTAELAAFSARTTNPFAYKELLLALSDIDKFKTPMVLYTAGVSVADSAPEKTIKLLIEASTLQQKKKCWLIDIEADRAAEQAARLAYDGFNQKNVDCSLAVVAFDNYTRIAADKMTEEMRYLYGEILLDCGKTQEASETFTKLADTSKTIWNNKASLKLLKIKINTNPEKNLPQLRQFILNCAGQDEQKRLLRLEAMDIYCRVILGSDINDSAAQVLNLLGTAEQTPGLRYDLFKAQALHRLGRLEESARYMSKAVIQDSNSSAALAAQIAFDIVDKIELRQKNANDFNELLRNCDALAGFAHKSADTPQTNLLLAEASILNGKTSVTTFPLTDDTISLRVQARLLMAQEKFEQSAKLWAKIAELRRNETPTQTQKSWHWWQAKFYELDCLAKSPSADKQNISHVIDVLCGSNPQIPAPWAEKLDFLKRYCAAN
jgi:tetratricopeptide (TPR) repeat protein